MIILLYIVLLLSYFFLTSESSSESLTARPCRVARQEPLAHFEKGLLALEE